MPNEIDRIDMVRDSTAGKIALYLAAIAKNTGGVEISGWKYVQSLVRAGLHKELINVGDIFIVEKETAMTARVGTTVEGGTPGITAASVAALTFLDKTGTAHSGDYEFSYDGAEWHFNGSAADLAEYGISVTGTPAQGDVVIVHETAAQMPYVVLGIDQDTPTDPQFTHSLTLGAVDIYTEMPFDAAEAFYCAENGLAAGNYYFTIDPSYEPSHNTYKNSGYAFTLTQAVPAKGVLTLTWASNSQASNIKIASYASASSASAIESDIPVSEGTTGTFLGQLTSAGDPAEDLNSIQRARYGNNCYRESSLRQYLNSDKAAGTYWTPQNKWDRPPSWAETADGFLRGVDPDFVSVLGKVNKITNLNNVTDGGGTETSSEKVFLLSSTETYCGESDGTAYDYFRNYSDLPSSGTGADTNRVKYLNGTARHWWLRSASSSSAYYTRLITPAGALNYFSARTAYGIVPVCVIV